MKFLTLISGKSVKSAMGIKRIPKEEFSQLISAQELLEKIEEEAKEQRLKIAKEGEIFFADSKKRGFEEGLKQWCEHIKSLEIETAKVKKDLQKFIVQIALSTAKKVVGREIEQNKDTIADIVMKNLRSVSSHRKVTIFANKNDLNALESHRERLKQIFDEIKSFHIQTREDIEEGGVIIETEAGIIDARAESLWSNIEKALNELIPKNN